MASTHTAAAAAARPAATTTGQVVAELRHDEQINEDYYDERVNSNDDMMKNKIIFSKKKLYGRDKELQQLLCSDFDKHITVLDIFLPSSLMGWSQNHNILTWIQGHQI